MNPQNISEISKQRETKPLHTKEEEGKGLKHEDELRDISNMDLAQFQRSKQVEKKEEIHQTQESQLPRKISGSSHDSSHSHSLKEIVQEGLHNITNILTHSVETVKSKLTSAKKQIQTLITEGQSPEKRVIQYKIGEEFREVVLGFTHTMEEAFQEERVATARRYIEENRIHYKIGEEFREVILGFTHTMDEAFQEERIEELSKVGIQENPFEPFGENDIQITSHPHTERTHAHDEDIGHEYLDFKIQDVQDLHTEGQGNESAHTENKSTIERARTDIEFIDRLLQKKILNTGKSEPQEQTLNIPKGTSTQPYQHLHTQGENIAPKRDYAGDLTRKANEGVDANDKLLDNVIQSAGKGTRKTENIEPSPSIRYQDLSQGPAVDKNASNLVRKVSEDINANDRLLNKIIYTGESSQPTETSKSSATDIYSQESQKFRDITNQVSGSQKSHAGLLEKAGKEIDKADKRLEKVIREAGSTGFGIESEDKENISMPKSSKLGTGKVAFGQSDLRNIPQNI